MPVNPCGRVVDYIRRPYSTLARFFKDDEGPPVIIQWYPAAADAPTMPFPSSFMSLDWTSETTKVKYPNWPDEPWLQRPGEIFQAARPFSPWPTPLGLDYSHLCGTEDEFANGATFDPDRDVKYDEQGLPLCCNGPIVPLFPLLVGFAGELEDEPDPGPDCPTAFPIANDTWQFFTNPGLISQYWQIPVTPGLPICFHIDPGTPNDLNLVWRIWRGDACDGALIRQESGNPGPEFTIMGNLSRVFVWVQVRNDGASPIDYGFKISSGAC